ncbi:unnamed protein product [Oncorhynchus mykiss]|uniref:Phorbol-ester/DAG-type domain-containing protein n=1 Tax=Oncorhynchus mykiss TaxID=8022 RepID=A0A060YGY1_ONCMY|nr:unnamed protein product [Oncorhynchus mykiss]
MLFKCIFRFTNFSSLSLCFADCAVNVHKSCRTLLAECNSSKNKKDSLHRTSTTASPNLALRDRDQSSSALDCPSGSPRIPGMTLTPRGPSAQPASAAFNSSSSSHTAAASLNHSHNSHTGLVARTTHHQAN